MPTRLFLKWDKHFIHLSIKLVTMRRGNPLLDLIKLTNASPQLVYLDDLIVSLQPYSYITRSFFTLYSFLVHFSNYSNNGKLPI